MSGLRPIGAIVAELLPKLAARAQLHRFDIASTATSGVGPLEANGTRPRMFLAEVDGDRRDRGAA